MREVSAGGSLIDPQVVEALVRGRARVRASALRDLTPRELDVLREMAQGRGNAGIAAHLHLSESSVEKHVNAIFTKLGLTTEDLSHRRITVVLTFRATRACTADPQKPAVPACGCGACSWVWRVICGGVVTGFSRPGRGTWTGWWRRRPAARPSLPA